MEWGFGLRVHSKNPKSYMSPLGHKQTYAVQKGGANTNVRFVP